MNTFLNLEVKKPCSENYDQFKPTEKGGFCDACHKEVVDFTKMNSKDIVSYFKTYSTDYTCGRFTPQQLNTPYVTNSTKNKYLSFFTGMGMAIFSFFSLASAEAQEVDNSNKNLTKKSNIESLKDKNNITVNGIIKDEDGLPLPGANVLLEGTAIGTTSNFDGYFEFPKKLKKGDVLVVSYLGYNAQKVIIENKKSASTIALKIDMIYDQCVIVGEVAVKELFKSKKN